MKFKGADVLAYFAAWPFGEHTCIDECEWEEVEACGGKPGGLKHEETGELMQPAQTYEISGWLAYDGPGSEPENFTPSLAEAIQGWLEQRDTQLFTIRVPKAGNGAVLLAEFCALHSFELR